MEEKRQEVRKDVTILGHIMATVCVTIGHDNHLGFYFKCPEKLLKCLQIDIG